METSGWDKTISAKQKPIFSNLKMIWEYRDLVRLFVKRDIIVYYKQTILGPLWYLAQPIFSTIIYLYIFGRVAGLGTGGIPQVLFYFSGTMLWTFFSGNLKAVSDVFIINKAMFGKVFFPRLVVPIASTVSLLIKLGIQLVLFLCIYVYYLLNGYPNMFSANALLFPLSICWLSILSLGMGMIISSVTTKYRDLSLMLDFILQLAMYAAPIVYSFSGVTDPIRTVLLINPVSVPVELFRYSMFGTFTMPSFSVYVSFGMMVIIFVIGMILFSRNERNFVDVI